MMQEAPATGHSQTAMPLFAATASPFTPPSNIGALAMISGEIHASLMQVQQSLQEAQVADDAAAVLAMTRARAGMHQVHGALLMLEIDGVDVLSSALENLLLRVVNGQHPLDATLVRVAAQTCQALHEYLQQLLGGALPQPLRLFPYYQELLQASGVERVNAADLFHAGVQLQRQPVPDQLDAAALPAATLTQADDAGNWLMLRQRFEKALLQYLKQPAGGSVAAMRDVIATVTQRQAGQAWYAFWWVMHGFADAVATHQLDNEFSTKQLFGRINMQLQRLSKATFCGNDSVLNDALFQLARIETPAPLQQAIRSAYGLDGLVPVNFQQKRYCRTDPAAWQSARSQLAHIKNDWNHIAQGTPDAQGAPGQLAAFAQAVQKLAAACLKLDAPLLSDLLAQLIMLARAPHAPADGSDGGANEAWCLEIAAALLVVESGLSDGRHAPEQDALRVAAMLARLQRLAAGAPVVETLAAAIEDHSSLAQQPAIDAVVEEMQSGLREVESLLEAFFRQESQAGALSDLLPRLRQIEGALAMLEQQAAVSAIEDARRVVGELAQGLIAPDAQAFDLLAKNVGALGLFMEALQCNAEQAKQQFSFNGQTRSFYVHDAVFDHVLHDAPAPVASGEAVTLTAAEAPRLAASVASMALAAPVAAQIEQTAQLAGVATLSADEVELREIFFSEAREVVCLINDTLAALHIEPASLEPMTLLRRYFHTLRGSARMVGLTEFSTAAGEIEQRLDRQLLEQAPADPASIGFFQLASNEVSDWLDELELNGSSTRHAAGFGPALQLRASRALALPGQPATVSDPATQAGTKQIGSLHINLPLYIIFRAETEELVRLLSQEIAAWRHAPDGAVSVRAVHAAHSLAGSSATVGLKPVHEVAFEIEAILQHQVRKPVKMAAYEFDMLSQATDCISHMLEQFSASQMPDCEPAMVQILQRVLHDIDCRCDAGLEHSALLARDLPGAAMTNPADASLALLPLPLPQILPANAFLAARFEAGGYHGYQGNQGESVSLFEVADVPDADLLPVFLEEAQDALPLLGQTLREWRRTPSDTAQAQALLRMAHTLKGSARMAGAMRLGQHLHKMEATIEQCVQNQPVASPVFDELLGQHDRVLQLLEQLRDPARHEDREPDAIASLAAAAATAPGVPVTAALVRVRTELLDRLVNQAGEVSISRSKLETELASLHQSLADLGDNVTRLRSQLREIEMQAESQINAQVSPAVERAFDALEFDRFTRLQELTRMMAESVDDVITVQQSLNSSLASASVGLAAQGRLTRALQQNLLQVRMVQFGSIADRLYRVVRQTAKEVGKRVNLDIRGAGLEVDRSVLERMAAPFEHLLRNAIVHGIEQEAARRSAGKSQIGELQIELRQEGNEIVAQFADDGCGLDFSAIRARGRACGLLGAEDAVPDAELIELIFNPGFSTAGAVTEAAGRGIGMDAVRSAAAGLGGTVAITSRAGSGMQVTIRLPLTLAVTQVVLVTIGRRTYALPSMLVEQVIELKPAAFASARAAAAVNWHGQAVALHALAHLLGEASDHGLPAAAEAPNTPVLILRHGVQRLAVHVDAIVGNREVVVKNTGPQLARVAGMTGATVLGSGEIVLIINPLQLEQELLARPAGLDACAAAPESTGAALIMVVDDSLTVRRVTQRLLVREGYQVVLAKDGVDALEHLQTVVPDVMLVDVEMPRMDGFDLTRNMRNDVRTHAVPVIMITSRTAGKHRDVALALGVTAYFGKPFQEADLLKAISRVLLATRQGADAAAAGSNEVSDEPQH